MTSFMTFMTSTTVLGVACKIPTERVAHRWLSAYVVTCRNVEMLVVLTIFYFAWVDVDKLSTCECIVNDIIRKADPAKFLVNKKQLDSIFIKLKSKQLTAQGLSRKKRIAEQLFNQRQLTHACMYLYCRVLPMFKSFVLTFEQKEPMVHKAHDELTELFRSFLACFQT